MPFLFFNQYYVIAVSIYSTFCAGEPTNERLSEWVSECALLLAFCLCLFECFLTLPSHFRIILTSSHLSVGIGIFFLSSHLSLSLALCLSRSLILSCSHSVDVWRPHALYFSYILSTFDAVVRFVWAESAFYPSTLTLAGNMHNSFLFLY